MHRRAAFGLPFGLLAGVVLVLAASLLRGALVGERFDLFRWEIETFPNHWLYAAGAPLRSGSQEPDAVLAQYFALAPEARTTSDLENAAEREVERRVQTVLHDLDLTARGIPGVFPPVDAELAISPQVLVTSPRDRIERTSADLLRTDLPVAEVLSLEADAETRGDNVSALVVRTGGVATYPAIVSNRSSYRGMVDTTAHEWTHHYLAFYPMGFSYYRDADTRTLNETVADLVGNEVASIVLDRWGDPTQAADATSPAGGAASPTVDVSTVLRELRLEVDDLLAAGEVARAETRMEQVRLELEQDGVFIRRINQAFFAWFDTYAARADAVDPLGGELRAIRADSPDLAAFLAAVRGVTTRREVGEIVVRLGAGGG